MWRNLQRSPNLQPPLCKYSLHGFFTLPARPFSLVFFSFSRSLRIMRRLQRFNTWRISFSFAFSCSSYGMFHQGATTSFVVASTSHPRLIPTLRNRRFRLYFFVFTLRLLLVVLPLLVLSPLLHIRLPIITSPKYTHPCTLTSSPPLQYTQSTVALLHVLQSS